MSARDLIDSIRSAWVANSSTSPTREITYTPSLSGVPQTLNSFVGGGNFNQLEKDTIDSYEAFGGLALTVEPVVNDTVAYNGKTWKVKRWTRLGTLYTVYGKVMLRAGAPKRG